MTLVTCLAWAAAGAALWTLLEYWLHRGLGHLRTDNAFGREHVRHHATTHYFAPAWKKAAYAAPVTLVVAAAATTCAGPTRGLALTAGLLVSYVVYEALHRRAHARGPRGPYGRWLRRHHLHHHFEAPSMNHGVTTPLWDLVFGTYARPGVIRVPAKHALPWLLGPDGEVAPPLADDYVLVRKRARPVGAVAAGSV